MSAALLFLASVAGLPLAVVTDFTKRRRVFMGPRFRFYLVVAVLVDMAR